MKKQTYKKRKEKGKKTRRNSRSTTMFRRGVNRISVGGSIWSGNTKRNKQKVHVEPKPLNSSTDVSTSGSVYVSIHNNLNEEPLHTYILNPDEKNELIHAITQIKMPNV